jgi:DNA repair protein RecO (recombination protein O)
MPSKERSLRDEGVVLRHTDWGEADRLLTVFTRKLGKVRAIAKGVRKPRSRKAGHLEPFTRSSLLLARGRDLFILTQAETIDGYPRLREDLETFGYASYIAELLDRFTHDEDENRSLYQLLIYTLTRLNRGDDPQLVIHYYEIRLLDLVGFRPQFFNCSVCGAEIQPEDQFFSANQGGVCCPRCGKKDLDARPVSMLALKYLRHYQRSNYQAAARANVPAHINNEIENLMHHYLTYLLERGLNSPAFLRHIRSKRKTTESLDKNIR